MVTWSTVTIYIQNGDYSQFYVLCAQWVLVFMPNSSSCLPGWPMRVLSSPLLLINCLSGSLLGGPGPPPFLSPSWPHFPQGPCILPLPHWLHYSTYEFMYGQQGSTWWETINKMLTWIVKKLRYCCFKLGNLSLEGEERMYMYSMCAACGKYIHTSGGKYLHRSHIENHKESSVMGLPLLPIATVQDNFLSGGSLVATLDCDTAVLGSNPAISQPTLGCQSLDGLPSGMALPCMLSCEGRHRSI